MSAKGDQSSKTKELQLPISRVKTIMKSSPDVENVGQEALYLVAKATEHFIAYLSKEANKNSNKKTLEYQNVAEIVQTEDILDFLREIMPRKITVKQYKDLMAKPKQSASEEESGSDETESSSEASS